MDMQWKTVTKQTRDPLPVMSSATPLGASSRAVGAFRADSPARLIWSVTHETIFGKSGLPTFDSRTDDRWHDLPVVTIAPRTDVPTAFRPVPPPRRGLSRRALIMAFAFIERNITENFSLDDLSRAAGVSRFHFSRLFRVSTGESPMAYALRLRIERAKEMLERGDRTVCEIAMDLSFFDQSHFSRTFRRITGLSPSEFMRRHATAIA